jgi:outer membrane protein OmpA-like peptidoglycan-associated protein
MKSFSKILAVLSLLLLSALPANAERILLRVSFAPDETTLSKKAEQQLLAFATDLKTSVARIELQAFAGDAGSVTSTQRRISLRRALVVRQLLLDQGIPQERMDVRALGGATGNTPLDRVDILQVGQ